MAVSESQLNSGHSIDTTGFKLAIVMPCFNEEAILDRSLCTIMHTFSDCSYNLLLIDDCSTDGSWAVITEFCRRFPHIQALRFDQNYGHQIALIAGLHTCHSDAVIILDADLQDPPDVAHALWEEWLRDPSDILYGTRLQRLGEPAWNRLAAALFYRLIRLIAGPTAQLDRGDFSLYSKTIVDRIRTYSSSHAYLRGFVHKQEATCRRFPYIRAPRIGGVTKYSLKKRIKLAISALFLFAKPIVFRLSFLAMASMVGGITAHHYGIAAMAIFFQFSCAGFSTATVFIAVLWYLDRRETALGMTPYRIVERLNFTDEPIADESIAGPQDKV